MCQVSVRIPVVLDFAPRLCYEIAGLQMLLDKREGRFSFRMDLLVLGALVHRCKVSNIIVALSILPLTVFHHLPPYRRRSSCPFQVVPEMIGFWNVAFFQPLVPRLRTRCKERFAVV